MGELLARVTAQHDALPVWPDPHPGHGAPREEEYSRVTDAERYRIVHERAHTWAAVLVDELGVHSETLGPRPAAGVSLGFQRGVRLVPDRPGALPLLLLERDVPLETGPGTLAVLDIALARPDVIVGRQPDCGCDACDSGSADLLRAVDETVCQVVGGPYVVLRGADWVVQWHPDGGSAGSSSGRPVDFDALTGLCRRLAAGESVALPEHAEALVSRSWLDG